jgi:hypothetical protein
MLGCLVKAGGNVTLRRHAHEGQMLS